MRTALTACVKHIYPWLKYQRSQRNLHKLAEEYFCGDKSGQQDLFEVQVQCGPAVPLLLCNSWAPLGKTEKTPHLLCVQNSICTPDLWQKPLFPYAGFYIQISLCWWSLQHRNSCTQQHIHDPSICVQKGRDLLLQQKMQFLTHVWNL